MTERKRSKGSQTFVWGVMGFLVLGMGGFGLSGAFLNTGGSAVASVGEEEISVDMFFQAYQQDVQRASQNFGVQLTLAQAQGIGVDQVTLARLLDIATIDNESRKLQISVGDDAVRSELMQNEAFRGLSGNFDETSYDFALQQLGLSRDEYDVLVRNALTQQIMRNALSITGVSSDTMSRAIMDYSGERRSFDWALITAEGLPNPASDPVQSELIAFYEANPDLFMQPESRDITYVALTPAILAETIEVSEDEIQREYEFRSELYQTQASIIADRLVFGTTEEAQAALDRLSAGDVSFEELALERGLSLPEISIGAVTENQVSPAARTVLFSAEEPGVVGPVTSNLGPALFRINNIRPAQNTSLADVTDEIRDAIALNAAGNMVIDMFDDIDDLIAGGVSLEDIAADTEMQIFKTNIPQDRGDGITADAAFLREAAAAEVDQERDIVETADGSIFVLRIDAINPESLKPLAEARDIAIDGYLAAQNQTLILDHAATLQSLVTTGADFKATLAANALDANSTLNITRNTNASETPQSVSAAVFGLDAGQLTIIEDANGAYLVKLTEISPFDPSDAESQAIYNGLEEQISLSLEADIYSLFTNAVRGDSDLVVNQPLINAIITQNSGG